MTDIDKKIAELVALKKLVSGQLFIGTPDNLEDVSICDTSGKEVIVADGVYAALIVAMHNYLLELIAEIEKLRNVAEAEFAEIESERDAANARAKKAEADLLIEQRVLAGFKVMLETANARAEQMQAERDVLANEIAKNVCAHFDDTRKCAPHDGRSCMSCWLEWASHEAAKRGSGEV